MNCFNALLGLCVVFSSAIGMELTVTTSLDRRPLEESMFEILAQHQERMAGLESTDRELSQQTLEQATLNAKQRVNGAKAQLTIDQEARKKNSDLLRTVIETKGTADQANQRLRERLESQAQEISNLRGQIRESREQQENVQAELQNQKHVAKWVYIAGGATLVVGGIVITRLVYNNGLLAKELSTLALEQNELRSQIIELKDRPYVGPNEKNELVVFRRDASGQKKESSIGTGVTEVKQELSELRYHSGANLSQMKADIDALKARPYVTKDHNNVLVLHNAPNGGGSVHGTHVKPYK